ncbi:MAG: hypothetical protein ACRDT6_15905 [Micromonosporaceae bacterium]
MRFTVRDIARLVALTATAVMLAGCGSGAVDSPDDQPTDRAGGAETTETGDGGEEFEFRLPVGETGVDAGESEVYPSIQRGECDQAQQLLDGSSDDPESALWPRFDNPRNVLLFQAGIALCAGDRDAAQGWYDQAEELGFAETDKPNICPMYQITSSVLLQREPDSFECEGGDAPDFITNADFTKTDDPRTPANEAEE